MSQASSAVAERAIPDFLEKIIPAAMVAKAIYTSDSYAFVQGACPEIYQRKIRPARCARKVSRIRIVAPVMMGFRFSLGKKTERN
jgi:hypothetical protein